MKVIRHEAAEFVPEMDEVKSLCIIRDRTEIASITFLKDRSLADLDNLPDPDVLAEETAENLESALGSFREVLRQLRK